MTHLTETQLQGLADGTLRGPEGMAAREHCEACAECSKELSLYSALSTRLSELASQAAAVFLELQRWRERQDHEGHQHPGAGHDGQHDNPDQNH